MKLFSFNEKSVLNSSLLRRLNELLFVCIILLGLSNKTCFEISFWCVVVMPIAVSILSTYGFNVIIKNTHFYEWDYSERCKKKRFLVKYVTMLSFISAMFSASVLIAYLSLSFEMKFAGHIMFILPVLFFGFNLPNIPSLYFPVFENELTLGYEIQHKPNNWKEDGEEIKNSDEVKEIMRRDWGVNI